MIQGSYHIPQTSQTFLPTSLTLASAYDVTQQMFGEWKNKSVKQISQARKLDHHVPKSSSSSTKSDLRSTIQYISLEKARDKLRKEIGTIQALSQKQNRPDEFLSLQQEIKALQERLTALQITPQQEKLNPVDKSLEEQLLSSIRELEKEKVVLETQMQARQHLLSPHPDLKMLSQLSNGNEVLKQEIAELQKAVDAFKARQAAQLVPAEQPISEEQNAAFNQRIHELYIQKKRLGHSPQQNSLEEPFNSLSLNHHLDDLDQAQGHYVSAQVNGVQHAALNERYESRHRVLTDQIAVLNETERTLQTKQRYCYQEIKKYHEAVAAKRQERAEIKAAYKTMREEVNALVKKRKANLKRMLSGTNDVAQQNIQDIKQTFQNQRIATKPVFAQKVADVQEINQAALNEYTAAMDTYCTEMQNARNKQLEQTGAIFREYWTYVNDGQFTIFNTHHNEYLYAADYAPYDDDRRRTFTWRRKNPVTQGTWKLSQDGQGKFTFFNIHQNEYLYAADYAPYDKDRRSVFTWRKDSERAVNQAYWKLTDIGNEEYRIFNTDQKEYLYASDIPFDDDRRYVFTWRPGNPVKQGDWLIKRIN